jgi:threonine dehydratase
MNHVLQRAPEGRDLCTYSSGNHGIAVALAAQILQRKATVFTPQDVTPLKAERLRELGANVIKAGTTSVERLQACLEHQRLSGDHVVPAFDDLEVITGQGTIALELMEDLEHIDNLLVPVGGGGLISGIASCLHWTRPNVKVFACEPEAAPTCFESFHHQKRITLSLGDTIADGLKPTTLGEHTFPRILDHVHDCLTVSELEIFNAMKDLFQRHKLVVEPSGAVPLACYFAHQERFANKNTVVILSGGNLSLAQLAQWGQRFERSGAP